eukprot:194313-Amphidinium_carterae.1
MHEDGKVGASKLQTVWHVVSLFQVTHSQFGLFQVTHSQFGLFHPVSVRIMQDPTAKSSNDTVFLCTEFLHNIACKVTSKRYTRQPARHEKSHNSKDKDAAKQQ